MSFCAHTSLTACQLPGLRPTTDQVTLCCARSAGVRECVSRCVSVVCCVVRQRVLVDGDHFGCRQDLKDLAREVTDVASIHTSQGLVVSLGVSGVVGHVQCVYPMRSGALTSAQSEKCDFCSVCVRPMLPTSSWTNRPAPSGHEQRKR